MAAAAGHQVNIPVVALLGVVVVMVAWAVDHLLVMAAAAMAPWVQLAGLRRVRLRPSAKKTMVIASSLRTYLRSVRSASTISILSS